MEREEDKKQQELETQRPFIHDAGEEFGDARPGTQRYTAPEVTAEFVIPEPPSASIEHNLLGDTVGQSTAMTTRNSREQTLVAKQLNENIAFYAVGAKIIANTVSSILWYSNHLFSRLTGALQEQDVDKSMLYDITTKFNKTISSLVADDDLVTKLWQNLMQEKYTHVPGINIARKQANELMSTATELNIELQRIKDKEDTISQYEITQITVKYENFEKKHHFLTKELARANKYVTPKQDPISRKKPRKT